MLEDENRALVSRVNQLLDSLISAENYIKELTERIVQMEKRDKSSRHDDI